jgi:alkylated DNA repair protein (DNA oxidative demethylase)
MEGEALMATLIPRERAEIAPGAVYVPDWLTVDEQRAIVEAWRGWAAGPVPMRAAKLPSGHLMSVRTVCLGWHWQPYRYTRTADDMGGARVADFPQWMVGLGRRAVAEAYGGDLAAARAYTPDVALINYYDDQARLGMHQDKDEKAEDPVVSLSIGDTCVFRFGNTETRTMPYTDVELASGDLFVFGGPSRFAYHGVPKTIPGTADPATGLRRGRINVTMRVTGMS